MALTSASALAQLLADLLYRGMLDLVEDRLGLMPAVDGGGAIAERVVAVAEAVEASGHVEAVSRMPGEPDGLPVSLDRLRVLPQSLMGAKATPVTSPDSSAG